MTLSSPLLHRWYVKRRYRTERQLLEGRHRPKTTHPSILHFSINRSATQYSMRVLSACARANGLTPVHMNGFAFESSLPYLDHLDENEMDAYRHVFKPNGYLYSVFGGFVRSIPDLDRFRIVLTLRDPRDVLTSLFFSSSESHRVPQDPEKAARFEARRSFAREATIDEFVLADAGRYGDRYREYVDNLVGRSNVHVAKYEQMIDDFEGWLDGILDFCDLAVDDELRRRLASEAAGSQPDEEDTRQHKRQVTPGDHRRKLKPATIEELDRTLTDVLTALDYE